MSIEQNDSSEQTWIVDPKQNLKEALGFLKDWVTTFLTLQTSIIGALAVFAGVRGAENFHSLSCAQKVLLAIAAMSALTSTYTGLYLLNMIPAAAQRKHTPCSPKIPMDLFSISTQDNGHTIKFWTDRFRISFLVTTVALLAFVVVSVTFVRGQA